MFLHRERRHLNRRHSGRRFVTFFGSCCGGFAGLLNENSKLAEEKRELQQAYDRGKEGLETSVRQLSQQLDEQQVRETSRRITWGAKHELQQIRKSLL